MCFIEYTKYFGKKIQKNSPSEFNALKFNEFTK